MSRSYHQRHGVKRKGQHPNYDRNRKHKPYGIHKTKWNVDVFKKFHWTPDTQEKGELGDVQNKAAARREGKITIKKQLEDE